MPYQLLTSEATFALGEIQTSKRGQKFAPICASQPLWQLTSLDDPLYCPFGAGVFQEKGTETRLNLDVRLSAASLATFEVLDKRFKEQIEKKYKLKSSYHPMIHDDGEYGARLRMKVSTQGMTAGMFWSPTKERLGTVKDIETRGARIVPVVGFSKVWMMGGLHGVTLELRHAIVAQTLGQEADFDWPMEVQEDPF